MSPCRVVQTVVGVVGEATSEVEDLVLGGARHLPLMTMTGSGDAEELAVGGRLEEAEAQAGVMEGVGAMLVMTMMLLCCLEGEAWMAMELEGAGLAQFDTHGLCRLFNPGGSVIYPKLPTLLDLPCLILL